MVSRKYPSHILSLTINGQRLVCEIGMDETMVSIFVHARVGFKQSHPWHTALLAISILNGY